MADASEVQRPREVSEGRGDDAVGDGQEVPDDARPEESRFDRARRGPLCAAAAELPVRPRQHRLRRDVRDRGPRGVLRLSHESRGCRAPAREASDVLGRHRPEASRIHPAPAEGPHRARLGLRGEPSLPARGRGVRRGGARFLRLPRYVILAFARGACGEHAREPRGGREGGPSLRREGLSAHRLGRRGPLAAARRVAPWHHPRGQLRRVGAQGREYGSRTRTRQRYGRTARGTPPAPRYLVPPRRGDQSELFGTVQHSHQSNRLFAPSRAHPGGSGRHQRRCGGCAHCGRKVGRSFRLGERNSIYG